MPCRVVLRFSCVYIVYGDACEATEPGAPGRVVGVTSAWEGHGVDYVARLLSVVQRGPLTRPGHHSPRSHSKRNAPISPLFQHRPKMAGILCGRLLADRNSGLFADDQIGYVNNLSLYIRYEDTHSQGRQASLMESHKR